MTTDQFIQKHKSSILNIDGNLDEATITILIKGNKLAFYWFENGVFTRSQIK